MFKMQSQHVRAPHRSAVVNLERLCTMERGYEEQNMGGGNFATRKKMADSTFGLYYKSIGIAEISVLRSML